jgi:hypothetical protein
MNKIAAMLDAVADSLEAKGLFKEAFEIDKVADEVSAPKAPYVPGIMPRYKEAISKYFRVGTKIDNIQIISIGVPNVKVSFDFMPASDAIYPADMKKMLEGNITIVASGDNKYYGMMTLINVIKDTYGEGH